MLCPLTMFFGPQNALLTMTVQFSKSFSSVQVESTVDEIEALIQEEFPDFRHIFLEVDTMRGLGEEASVPEGFAGTKASAAAEEKG